MSTDVDARQPISPTAPDGEHAPANVPAPARMPLSAGQVQAIYSAMRTFRDDDRARVDPAAEFRCHRCGRTRALHGSLVYGDVRLCNGCATDYELLRTAGMEGDLLAPGPGLAEGDSASG